MGYDRENVLMFSVDAKLAGYPDDRAGAVYREILQRLEALPDVRQASASIVRPVDDQFYLIDQVGEVDGRKLPERETIHVAWNSISRNYFSTISTPILLGRDFDQRDNETAPPVVIVNESLARRAFSGQNPIGHRLGAATVVGVVKDSHYNGARATSPGPCCITRFSSTAKNRSTGGGLCPSSCGTARARTCWTRCAGKSFPWTATCRSSAPGRCARKPNSRC